jgi:ABC transporter, cydDC cysteine exporter family, permease/ATP-binding protein cydD
LHNVDYVLNLENGKVVDFEKVVDFKNSPRFEKLKNNLVGGGYSEK